MFILKYAWPYNALNLYLIVATLSGPKVLFLKTHEFNIKKIIERLFLSITKYVYMFMTHRAIRTYKAFEQHKQWREMYGSFKFKRYKPYKFTLFMSKYFINFYFLRTLTYYASIVEVLFRLRI